MTDLLPTVPVIVRVIWPRRAAGWTNRRWAVYRLLVSGPLEWLWERAEVTAAEVAETDSREGRDND